MKRTSRLPLNLPESLHQRLNSYALAASAAGVGMLALAQPSEAKVIYTRTHHEIDHEHQTYMLDLGHHQLFEIRYETFASQTSSNPLVTLRVRPPASGEIDIHLHRPIHYFYLAQALAKGGQIGSSDFLYGGIDGVMVFKDGTCRSSCTFGYWVNVTDRYLGLRFLTNGKPHFGWARLSVQVGRAQDVSALLTGYAYETVANKPIITGQTKGPDVATVHPASLGHLAHGASAIPAWRMQSSAH